MLTCASGAVAPELLLSACAAMTAACHAAAAELISSQSIDSTSDGFGREDGSACRLAAVAAALRVLEVPLPYTQTHLIILCELPS